MDRQHGPPKPTTAALKPLWHHTRRPTKRQSYQRYVCFQFYIVMAMCVFLTQILQKSGFTRLIASLVPFVWSKPFPALSLWPSEDFIQGIKAQPAYGHLAQTTRYLGAKIAFACKPKCRLSSHGTFYFLNLFKLIYLVSCISPHQS